jgi:hypothetical protein
MNRNANNGLPTRYWGPFRQEFYSFSSKLRYDEEEYIRNGWGTWYNVYWRKVDSYIHDHHKKLWLWYMNDAPWVRFSKSHKSLLRAFPNLRKQKDKQK